MFKLKAECKQNTCANGRNCNAGFSIVELIIVVSILAIAAVPLMKSMSMASKTNARAQSIQNATSLGESIMEEVKSSPIETLGSFDASGKMIINRTDQTSTQGETFDVVITVDKTKYQGADTFDMSSSTSASAKKANVGSANTLKIPKIEDIDSQSQAVLSTKELNKYDTEALNYFNQRLSGYNSSSSIVATIKSKTINIVKDNLGSDFGVNVKATVTYTDNTDSPYTRDLYSGTFMQQERTDGSGKKHFDSNIYIFYKVGTVGTPATEIREEFVIEDKSNVSTFEGYDSSKPMDSHRVYFIRQDILDKTGPKKISFKNGSDVYGFKFSDKDDLVDGRKVYGNVELVTNLVSDLSDQGYIYKKEARTRVYDIKVELYKDGEFVTSLNSTATANDPI